MVTLSEKNVTDIMRVL